MTRTSLPQLPKAISATHLSRKKRFRQRGETDDALDEIHQRDGGRFRGHRDAKSVFCVVVADVEDAFVAVVLVVVCPPFCPPPPPRHPKNIITARFIAPEKLPRGLVKDDNEDEDAIRRARSRPPFLSTPFAPVIARGRRHTCNDIVVVVVIVRDSIRPPKVRVIKKSAQKKKHHPKKRGKNERNGAFCPSKKRSFDAGWVVERTMTTTMFIRLY